MNLTKIGLLFLLVFFFFSCASTTDTGTEENIELKKEPEIVLVEKEVIDIIYYPVVEKKFYGNNQIDVIKKYEYNNDYQLIKSIEQNEQEEVLNTIIYEYKDNLLIKETSYNFNNELTRTITYKYNPQGQIVQEDLLGKDDKLQSSNIYEYEGDILVTWRTLGPNLSPLGTTKYIYTDGLLTSIEIKEASGKTDGIINKKYEDNLIILEEVIDSKGTLERKIEYNYSNKKLNEVSYYDSKNKLERKEEYSYKGDNPKPFTKTFYYKSGAVESYTNIEYNTREVKRIVFVEEYK